jgi:hypothetical protein
MRADPLRCRRGFALQAVLVTILAATMILSTAVFLTVTDERAAGSAARRARLAAAAETAVAEMQERLLLRVEAVAGRLEEEDLAALNASLAALSVPAGMELDGSASGWRLIEVREQERIPHDEAPLAAWPDQPRLSYSGLPPVGGLVGRTLVVSVFATVRDGEHGAFRVRRDLALTQVPPHQHALYVMGDAELCASAPGAAWIGGAVRVDGTLVAAACPHLIRYGGSVEARDGIVAPAPASHFLVGPDGETPLASLPRSEAEASPTALLSRWGGRVRVGVALGGRVGPGRLSTPAVAGTGECEEVPAAGDYTCGGRARYSPSVQVRRTATGAGTAFEWACGAAYPDGCPEVLAAITYHPWPFEAEQLEGVAAPDPGAPLLPWRGLLPDARRESRCTATVGGETYRTARCPTNLYGFRIDVGALPPVHGGLLSIRRAAMQVPGADPAAEVVLLTNAAALAGPLTIHSELPVYLEGSFNVAFRPGYSGPPPAMIDAPRITVLPNEAPWHLRTSAVWDSVPAVGSGPARAMPLRAESNVSVYAVLRAGFCGTVEGMYFGGAWEGIPAVLGDWSAAGLRIVGAVEGRQDHSGAAGCARFWHPLNVPPPSGTATLQPASRTLLFDERLLHPGFRVPGSWSAENVSATGVPGGTSERQARASGGTVVVRRVRDDWRGLPPVPPGVSVPPARALPSAPLPLP